MSSSVTLPLDRSDLSFTASGGTLVKRSVLPTGVRVLTEQVPGSRSVTIGFWVAVGSRDEEAAGNLNPASFGSTHFLEHLLFKGTKRRTALEIAVAFDAVGGVHNAHTAKEYTCYFAKVLDRDLPMAVDVLADMFTSSVISDEEFETERGVILEELSMAADDPSDVANERFYETVLGDHPLGRPIGGNPDTIKAATRQAVWEHYQANYRPQDLVVTAAGAVDHDMLITQLTTALTAGGWDPDAHADPVPRRLSEEAALSVNESLAVIERPNEQMNLFLGTTGLINSDDRRWTMSVLTAVFGSGMSSRLFQEVRERRGLAYSVYAFSSSYSDAGIFGMYAGCAPANAKSVSDLMWQELEKLATDGITTEERSRALGQMAGTSALALEDSDTRMSRLGRSELSLGEFNDLDESLRRLGLVTANDVKTLAADLVSRKPSLVAVGPLALSAFR